MDMKRILQAMDGVATKPVVGVDSMAKFLSIIDKNANVQLLQEATPHKVSLPVQMAMQHYQQPKEKTQLANKPVGRETTIGKYFHKVEDEIAEHKAQKRQLINQYASTIAERVLMKESKQEEKAERIAKQQALKSIDNEHKVYKNSPKTHAIKFKENKTWNPVDNGDFPTDFDNYNPEKFDSKHFQAMLDYYGNDLNVDRALRALEREIKGNNGVTPLQWAATFQTINNSVVGKPTPPKEETKYFKSRNEAYHYAHLYSNVLKLVHIEKLEQDAPKNLITLPVILGIKNHKRKWMLQFPDEQYAQKWQHQFRNVAKIQWPAGHALSSNVEENEIPGHSMGFKPGPGTPGTLEELSTDTLGKYKKAAYADAKKADAEGNYARGDKRFKGINKATVKQFDNDLKKHEQNPIKEANAKKRTLKNSNPCWTGYHPVGTKKKGGRTVPNCVPKE